jgi:tetratricopeptide (TPR) repeat protein
MMTRKTLLTLFSLTLMFACFSALSVDVKAQTKKQLKAAKDLTDDGNAAFNKRNYRMAIEKYAQAIAIVPNSPDAHFWKGNAHYNLKEYDQALSELDTALAQGFKADQVKTVRWYINYEKKNYDAALSDLEALIPLDPANVTLLIGRGDAYAGKKSYNEALAAYQKALAAAPANADVQYKIATSHQLLGNFKEQGIAAQAAIKGNTIFLGEAYFLLGESFQKQRNLTEAGDAYLKSIAAKPNNYASYRNLADVYRGQGRFKDAIEVLKSSFPQFPPNGETFTELSWYYSLVNRDEDAVEAAKGGVRLTPGNFASHTNLCRAYNGTKQFDLAIVSCTRALRLKPNDGETYFYLGRAQDSLGKTADAAKSYKKAVAGLTEYTKQNPEYTDGFYLLGNALLADNQLDKAVAANKRAVDLSPGFAKARYNLAIIYLAQKKKALAQEQYDELVKIDPDQAAKLRAEMDK